MSGIVASPPPPPRLLNPTAQFCIEGFSTTYRLDRDRNGGGILIYVREDIPSRLLTLHDFPYDIEGLFVEINLRKTKWLLFGTYHPPSQNEKYFFHHLGKALDIYSPKYEKLVLTGDFNSEEGESCLDTFLCDYDAKNIVKEKACFKNIEKPSCIDLIITNSVHSFQNTSVISTGLSDFHKMVLTVVKTTFRKNKPREIIYRDYSKFDSESFKKELKESLDEKKTGEYKVFEETFLQLLFLHASTKKKVIRANNMP